MWTPVYYVRQIALPAAVEGLTVPNEDGSFDIYLNENIPPDRMEACLAHEVEHIMQDHFYQETKTVAQLEREASSPAGDAAQEPPRLPDVFFDPPPPGTIPVFASLDAMKHYLVAFCAQRRADRQREADRKGRSA